MIIEKELKFIHFSHESTFFSVAWDNHVGKFVVRVERDSAEGKRTLLFGNLETGLSPSIGDLRLICQHYGAAVPMDAERQLISQWRDAAFEVSDQLPERLGQPHDQANKSWVKERHIIALFYAIQGMAGKGDAF